jgi:cytochrome P450
MFTAYGTAHTRLRTIVAKALTPRRTALLAPRVREITGELLDRLAATPAGDTTDLRAALAYPVPIQVVCDLFEVPPEARQHVLRFGELAFNGATEPGVAEAIQQRLVTTLTDMVGTRGATPGDDMVSDLIAARDDGDGSRLTGQELLDTLILVLSAGFETTINLLDNAIFALLSHPGQLALVHAGDATWDDVIEEALRWQAPVPNVPMRYAVEDLRLPDGTVIPRGDAIIVSFGAAGRDPAQHGADADDFDVRRATRRDHLAFGHGVHYCLGVSLARLEAGTVLPALFARFPDMTLAVPAADVAPIGSFLANGHRTLPVVLRPA